MILQSILFLLSQLTSNLFHFGNLFLQMMPFCWGTYLAAEDGSNHGGIILEATTEIGLTRKNLHCFCHLPQTGDWVFPTKIFFSSKTEALMDVGR